MTDKIIVICRSKSEWLDLCKNTGQTGRWATYWGIGAATGEGAGAFIVNGVISSYCHEYYWYDVVAKERHFVSDYGGKIITYPEWLWWRKNRTQEHGNVEVRKEARKLVTFNIPYNMTSTLREKMALVFKGEPEKSFMKAGIMNADESLTSDGRAIFETWLLKKHGAEFKTDVVDPILSEDKASA